MVNLTTEKGKQRLTYIDWARGLACFGMFEVHCYDAWLGGAARQSSFYGWTQLSGTVPAPLFVFLAGVSFALVSDRMRSKNATPSEIFLRMFRRGAEIFGLAFLFRAQEFVFGIPLAPWTDLLRVDVLNMMGLSIILMALLSWIVQDRTASAIAAAAVALGIALATPMLWTSWRPHWLPWYIESYINGVHIYNSPQSWLFPVFPWAGFAFAGLAAGYTLFSNGSAKSPGRVAAQLGGAGLGMCLLSLALEFQPIQIYPVHDYWHTSPNFFLMRVGLVLITICFAYAWCQWGPGAKGFSPLIRLGQASLLVYWVHNEFVYGRLSILAKRQQGIFTATLGLLVIFILMVLLATREVTLERASALRCWPSFGSFLRTPAEG